LPGTECQLSNLDISLLKKTKSAMVLRSDHKSLSTVSEGIHKDYVDYLLHMLSEKLIIEEDNCHKEIENKMSEFEKKVQNSQTVLEKQMKTMKFNYK